MKVISIQQPFASLIAEGLKEYEFRTWKPAYRGEILIHACKGISRENREAMKKFAGYHLEYPTGCIIARARLTDCVKVDDRLKEELREKNFVVYSGTTEHDGWEGYGFHLEDIEKIEPVFASGKLGLWNF